MALKKTLDKLEEKFFGELEEDRDAIIPELKELQKEAIEAGGEELKKFNEEMRDRFGGIFIPYIFWTELYQFTQDETWRAEIRKTVDAFASSNFEEPEQKKMKHLLIPYFTMEKEFELDKMESLIVNKAHPMVREYFENLSVFSDVNKTSVKMYVEKFELIGNQNPDFELLRLPVMKLKEQLPQ